MEIELEDVVIEDAFGYMISWEDMTSQERYDYLKETEDEYNEMGREGW